MSDDYVLDGYDINPPMAGLGKVKSICAKHVEDNVHMWSGHVWKSELSKSDL